MYESLYEILNNEASDSRTALLEYLMQAANEMEEHRDLTKEIAYNIAGLMATDFARDLADGDPIEEILTIAGELEVMPQNHDALRAELVTKIKALQ